MRLVWRPSDRQNALDPIASPLLQPAPLALVAIYHFSAKVIGRSAGRSAVAAAAYRSASRLDDERQDRAHDFTAKRGVVHSEILLPEDVPERLRDRATLWNEVEAIERRRDAVLARDVEFALPRELSQAEGIALAQDFVQRAFVDRGMVADLNVHWDVGPDGEAKPHAHVMLSMREVGPEGFGRKVREWNDVRLLREWREGWAEHVNTRLAGLGHELRVDHRSYRDQGIALEPQNKIGPAGQRREERGEAAERAAEHRDIARRNGARLLAEPEIALRALTHQHATFTRADVARLVHRQSDGAEQFAAVMARVEGSAELVRLGEDDRGRERLTTREMLAVEARMEQAAERLAEGRGHGVGEGARERALREAEGRGLRLGAEQRDALAHVVGERDLALVVGFAGTGKSAMLGVAREAWEAQGCMVRGAALSGIAAEGLEGGSGIASRTIASLEHAWGQGRDLLSAGEVLVIDEAGMIGSRQMERVLSVAAEAGAKVVLVGDPEQLQAIEAGAAFRALADRHGTAEISAVRRQRETWQRQATRELATGRTGEALGRYEQAGMVEAHATREAARAALVAGWDAERRAAPEASRLMLASTREDVRALNALARAHLREAGEIGADHRVETERGPRTFAAGDRVMFLANERGLGVRNGTLGRLERIEAGHLTVRLDGAEGRTIGFDLKDYADLDHGYAATVHKAQGVTVDRAHVLATPLMDRHAAYVGLTRHREGGRLHYGRDDFRDREALARVLGRERAKDTTLDYGPLDPAPAFAERRGIRVADGIARRVREGAQRETAWPAPAREVEASTAASMAKGSPFAGLKLRRSPAREVETGASAGPTLQRAGPDPARVRLEAAARGYAEAWADARRMTATNLPVLPHQALALEAAGQELGRLRPGGADDLAAVLARDAGAERAPDRSPAGLVTAMEEQRRWRTEPSYRAERLTERWQALERTYDLAPGREARVQAWGRMEEFVERLGRDPQAESLMRARARAPGIATGSRLEDLVLRREERVRAIELSLARSRGLGLGL